MDMDTDTVAARLAGALKRLGDLEWMFPGRRFVGVVGKGYERAFEQMCRDMLNLESPVVLVDKDAASWVTNAGEGKPDGAAMFDVVTLPLTATNLVKVVDTVVVYGESPMRDELHVLAGEADVALYERDSAHDAARLDIDKNFDPGRGVEVPQRIRVISIDDRPK